MSRRTFLRLIETLLQGNCLAAPAPTGETLLQGAVSSSHVSPYPFKCKMWQITRARHTQSYRLVYYLNPRYINRNDSD